MSARRFLPSIATLLAAQHRPQLFEECARAGAPLTPELVLLTLRRS